MAGRFRAAVDGGSRGNPGRAAWGVAILDDDGRYVEGHAGTIGRATNNVAEYRALLEALARAAAAGAADVEIRADSELIVRQIEGRYKVRHPGLLPLHAEAKRRISRFRSFRIVHIPRHENADADRLVNLALDRAEKARTDEALCVLVVPEPRAGKE
jgi:ribonuclease HI